MKLTEWEWESKQLRASSTLYLFEIKTTTSVAMPRARSCNVTNNTTNVNILSNNTLRNIRVNVNQGLQGGVRVGQNIGQGAVNTGRKAVSAVRNFLKF